MPTKSTFSHLLQDIFFIFFLLGLSLALIFFYFDAKYFDPGYPDWIVQAFRIKILDTYGLISWIHNWSNGISIWRSYQFIPHYITLGIANLFHLEISRAMVVLTIVQFVGLRLLIYTMLRLLHFRPLTAFLCALLSFALSQYWSGVAEYSLLFGFTFFPIIIFLWIQYHHGKLQNFYPYCSGLSFYIHPLLGFSALGLWAVSVLFSEKKIISFQTLLQFVIILATSSLFWFPIVAKLSYFYTNPTFSTKYFLDLPLSQYSYYGLSLSLIIALMLCVIWIFKPIAQGWNWSKVLTFWAVGYLLFIIIGLTFNLPSAFYQFQYSRGATLIGIAIVFCAAVFLERPTTVRTTLVKVTVIFVVCLSLVESVWIISTYSPQPLKEAEDIVQLASEKQLIDPSEGRILTPTIHWSSYLASLDARYPYSYMEHMDSNQIPQRLSQLVFYHPYFVQAPDATLHRLNAYYDITGTKYLLLDENSPFTPAYQEKIEEYNDLGRIDTKDTSYHLFEKSGEIRNGILVDKKYEDSLKHFPFDLRFNTVQDQIALDSHVEKFVDILHKPENRTLRVVYPTPDSLEISIPSPRTSNLIFINESHDIGWKAYLNGKEQQVIPSGPNYMVIILDSDNNGGTLILKHSWPIYFFIGLFFIFLIPLEIGIITTYLLLKKKL